MKEVLLESLHAQEFLKHRGEIVLVPLFQIFVDLQLSLVINTILKFRIIVEYLWFLRPSQLRQLDEVLQLGAGDLTSLVNVLLKLILHLPTAFGEVGFQGMADVPTEREVSGPATQLCRHWNNGVNALAILDDVFLMRQTDAQIVGVVHEDAQPLRGQRSVHLQFSMRVALAGSIGHIQTARLSHLLDEQLVGRPGQQVQALLVHFGVRVAGMHHRLRARPLRHLVGAVRAAGQVLFLIQIEHHAQAAREVADGQVVDGDGETVEVLRRDDGCDFQFDVGAHLGQEAAVKTRLAARVVVVHSAEEEVKV